MVELIAFCVFLGSIVGAVLVRGWALATLWNWFVAPTFHTSYLTTLAACGISLVVGMFQTYKHPNKSEESSGINFIMLFVCPLIAVFMGWVLLHWM